MAGEPSSPSLAPRARRNPNIIITGTPGTGKTTHCEALAARIAAGTDAALAELRHIAVNDVVRERGCHDGWDAEFQSWIVDEDRLLDELEPELTSARGGCIVDWHACDLFPESSVDLVVVLTADTESLYDRLVERYSPCSSFFCSLSFSLPPASHTTC